MRFKWFKKLKPPIQLFVLATLVFVILALYIPLSKYIKFIITPLLSPPLKLCQGVSSNAQQLLKFQNIDEENKRLKKEMGQLNAQLLQLQEAQLENQRLRNLLSLPEKKPLQTCTALLIGKDSSNWTRVVMINKGITSGIKEGMPVVLGAGLVGRVIETTANVSKVALIIDFNSKVPALIQRTREGGIVFGALKGSKNICRMKYIQGEVELGDTIISSGLAKIYPKGILIGKVTAVQEEKAKLYKIAEIQPAVNFSSLEEVTVILDQ